MTMAKQKVREMEAGTASPGGFSLLEILVVVVVVVILVGLLVGGLYRARQKAARSVAQQELNSVAHMVEQYYSDMHAYPISTPYGDVPSGGAALAQALVGWRPYAEDGAGIANGDPDDYGFRLQQGGRGQKFGPYLPPGGKNYDAARHLILDHWGNPVLYYRATAGTPSHVFGTASDGIFVATDNAGSPGIASDFLKLLGNAAGDNTPHPGETIANRSTFLLVSGTADGVYFTSDGMINAK